MRTRIVSKKEEVEAHLLKRARNEPVKQIEEITASYEDLRNNVRASLCNLKQNSSPEEFRQAVYAFVKYQFYTFSILHDALEIYENPEDYKEKLFKQLNNFNALLLQSLDQKLPAEDLSRLKNKLLSVNGMERSSPEEKACYFFISLESWSRQYIPENPGHRKCDFSRVSRPLFDFLISKLGNDFSSSSVPQASAKKSRIEPEPIPVQLLDFLLEARQLRAELELLEIEQLEPEKIDIDDFELDAPPALSQDISFDFFKPKTDTDESNMDEFQIEKPLPFK